jgi:hypothetical protein
MKTVAKILTDLSRQAKEHRVRWGDGQSPIGGGVVCYLRTDEAERLIAHVRKLQSEYRKLLVRIENLEDSSWETSE